MANKTANYDLTKPLVSEFYDVEVQNGNMDKIDAALKKDADSIKTLQDGQKKKADLGEDGKVLTEQLPEMNYDPTGTATQAVSTHNTSPNAHTSLFAAKQNKLTGAQGQVVGFDSQGNAQAQDPPSGGSGKRVCRFVVGTSTAGWTADDCDYLCDGTADDVEINAAIQALPGTGGEIVILDGTYNITATIAMNKNNVTLSGNGASTVLNRMFKSVGGDDVIDITAAKGGCCVKSLKIYGNKDVYNTEGMSGISSAGSGDRTSNIIKNNTLEYCNTGLSTRTNDICIGNVIKECSTGIAGYPLNGLIASNIICDCNIGLKASGYDNVFVNNNFIGCPTAISANQLRRSLVSGNLCWQSTKNTIYVTDSASENNLFIGNMIFGKNYVDGGTNSTFANNKYQ